jgi:hypothetical protein
MLKFFGIIDRAQLMALNKAVTPFANLDSAHRRDF